MTLQECSLSGVGRPPAIDTAPSHRAMTSTYSVAEAAERIGGSERWVAEQIRAGRFPARKIARHWRMTEQDIADALDACRNNLRNPDAGTAEPAVGLTARSKKRLVGISRTEPMVMA